MEWQPIETAPKDGTHILGYCTGWDEQTFQYVLMWTDDPNGAWMETGGEDQYTFTPTHWMPLPAPPQPKQE